MQAHGSFRTWAGTGLIAALAAIALPASAQSTLIDDFNSGDQHIIFGSGNAVGTHDSDSNAWRTLSATLTQATSPVNSEAQVDSGVLDITNSSRASMETLVQWNLSAGQVPAGLGPSSFTMQVIHADDSPMTIDLLWNGSVIGSYNQNGAVNNQTFSIPLGNTNLSSGGLLGLRINGARGYDLTLDYVSITPTVPEPASLGLMQAGLAAGAGLKLRRKAQNA
jgi:hypothetical protein